MRGTPSSAGPDGHGPAGGSTSGGPPPGVPGLLDVAAFAGELVLVVLVGVSGWRLAGGGPPSVLLAGALVAVVVTTWAVWLAPRSGRRLGRWGRWSLVTALVAGNVALADLAAGPVLPAAVLAVVMSGLFARRES